MKTLLSATAIVLLAAPGFAGDWTGAYGGFGVGYADVNLSGGLAGGDGGAAGLHIGYNHDFGDWVLGGEFEYDWTDIGFGGVAVNLDNVSRLKLKLGYDFDQVLAYAVVGGAWAYTDVAGSDNGWLAGLGVAYEIKPQWMISGEVLYHDFSNFNGTATDIDATSFAVRLSYRF